MRNELEPRSGARDEYVDFEDHCFISICAMRKSENIEETQEEEKRKEKTGVQ